MTLSKQKLVTGIKRTRFSWDEEIKILSYSSGKLTKSLTAIATQFIHQLWRLINSLVKNLNFLKGNCKVKNAW